MKYIGFDLGDGESSVALISSSSKDIEPIVQKLDDKKSFISAVIEKENEILIGEQAITYGDKNALRVRFKSGYSKNSELSEKAIILFAKGVMDRINKLNLDEDIEVTVGCPAGWNLTTREKYKNLLVRAGLPNVRIISESRAAFLYVREAKNIRVNPELLKKSVLVVDIGSSTLDFAYIVKGKETGIGVFGNNNLGGGLIDEYLLEEAIENNIDRKNIKKIFEESYGWRSYAELTARKVKEKYFINEEEYKEIPTEDVVTLYYDKPQSINIKANDEIMRRVINKPLEELDGKSFMEALQNSLYEAGKATKSSPPELLILTGGASRMKFFREQCRFSFPDAIIVNSEEPEYSIAKGLAYSGIIDERLQAFRTEVKEFIKSGIVEESIQKDIVNLINPLVEKLTDFVINVSVIPTIELWKKSKIDTIEEMNNHLNMKTKEVLNPDEIKKLLEETISKWSVALCKNLQVPIDEICNKYYIPKEEMSLLNVGMDTNFKDIDFAIDKLEGENIINIIITLVIGVLVGMICGGSGLALIATGPLGFLGGVVIGGITGALGYNKTKHLFIKKSLPKLVRKLVRKDIFLSEKTREKLSNKILEELKKDNNSFSENLGKSIGMELNNRLENLAQEVEIPIF